MATLRTLVTKLRLDAVDAVKGLKAYDKLWKAVAKSVESSAAMVERSADRAVAALQRMGEAAAVARVAAGGVRIGGGGGGGGGSRTRNPEAAAQRAAEQAKRNEERLARQTAAAEEKAARDVERRARQQEREAASRAKRGRPGADPLDDIVSRGRKSGAAQAGLTDGSRPITAATDALGRFATAQDRARAKVADLTASVARNREEMARLKRQAVETGDADGTLAARMRGLAVATLDTTAKLQGARRELRSVEGGLLDAVKAAGGFRAALSTAAGNVIAGVGQRVAGGIAGGIAESAKAAMDFEKRLVDVRKVAKGLDDTDEGFARIKDGIKAASTDLGVMPDQVAALAAQLTAGFTGGKADLVELTKDVTKIGVAWDITGEQAGEYFKQTSAGLQLNADETKALFGSINQLSNEFGIKASEIAEAMTRSAGVLKGANISGETGAALNATLIKAGASAEVAATGVRTFIARLGAGEAATDKQVKAFTALGLSAKDVAKNLASGDAARAEKQIKEVVEALVRMGKEAPEKKMATLIELFGSESIGSIGAAASATENLATAFGIAGDKAAALTSVQNEYDRVSNTTAARMDKLKAQVAVLALEFGEALLPHLDKVLAFFQTDEGKEWGKSAVEGAIGAVTTLAEVISAVVSGIGFLVEKLGGAETAVIGLGIAVAGLAGPWGIVAAAALAAISAISKGLGTLLQQIPGVGDAITGAADKLLAERARILGGGVAGKIRDEDDAAYAAAQDRPQTSLPGGVEVPEALAPMGPARPPATASSDRSADMARFDELVRQRNSSQDPLPPAEAKELRSLSKRLNRAIPHKPGNGRTHKQTKMDKQLAAIDPSVRGVLTRGGEKDKGGDLMVGDNALDKAVLDRSSRARGLGGVDGVGGVGPGPNITNHYTYINTTIQQAIDARGPGNSSDNLAASGQQVAANVAGAIRFTGGDRLVAARNAGGVRRGPA